MSTRLYDRVPLDRTRNTYGNYPPLAGDPVVTASDPTQHIEVVLFGKRGSIINGIQYQAHMPSWKDQLSDKEVAAIINHERTSWGNNAPTVKAEQVAAVRKKGEAAT